MINMFDLWGKFCSDNNVFQGGMFRPERDFEKDVNSISLEAFADFTAQDEKSQQIIDWLSPFANTVNIITTPLSGNEVLAKYPHDNKGEIIYGAYKAARSLQHKEKCLCDESSDVYQDGKCASATDTELQRQKRIEAYKDGITEVEIIPVKSSAWASCLTHETKCPTFENPKLTQFKDGFKVAPRQVSVIVLDYYRNPVPAKFAYSIAPGNPQTGAGDYLIYNQAQSKDLEWPQSMIPYFLDKLQQKYAKFTLNSTLFQMNKAS